MISLLADASRKNQDTRVEYIAESINASGM